MKLFGFALSVIGLWIVFSTQPIFSPSWWQLVGGCFLIAISQIIRDLQ